MSLSGVCSRPVAAFLIFPDFVFVDVPICPSAALAFTAKKEKNLHM